MITESSRKVTDDHLKRDAFLYVRQAVLRQELENTENPIRQYALRDRALALGWPLERIHVIDCDQGLSGASTYWYLTAAPELLGVAAKRLEEHLGDLP